MGFDFATFALLAAINASAMAVALVFWGVEGGEDPVPHFPKLGAAFALMILSHVLSGYVSKSSLWVQLLVSLTIPLNAGAVIPNMLESLEPKDRTYDETLVKLAFVIGAACRILGTVFILWTVRLFFIKGKGTLSPDPDLQTKLLVIQGPYAYVRNPMILGVVSELVGIALMSMSLRVATYTLCFIVIKTIWFIVSEEPDMEKRFGSQYKAYKAEVPRWIPSFRSYKSSKA